MPIVVAVLFLAGMLIILYPTIAGWINQYQQSRIISALSDEVDQLPPDGRAEALALAHEYNRALVSGDVVLAAQSNRPTSEAEVVGGAPYREQLAANDQGLMARIKIPAIALDLPIYHGTGDRVLLKGVGHLEGTSLPVGGASTHAVLTAHRGLASAEMFTRLNEVGLGDTFTVEVFGEVLSYRVRSTQVVDPDDTETLRPVRDEDLITLVTCTPVGVNSQRILVTGERIVPTPAADIADAGRTPDVPGFPWWAIFVGGTAAAAAGYVWWSGRSR